MTLDLLHCFNENSFQERFQYTWLFFCVMKQSVPNLSEIRCICDAVLVLWDSN